MLVGLAGKQNSTPAAAAVAHTEVELDETVTVGVYEDISQGEAGRAKSTLLNEHAKSMEDDRAVMLADSLESDSETPSLSSVCSGDGDDRSLQEIILAEEEE
mmetsp:Transcript_44285/g.111580  ORF Transcript_44285/g.111580 Transcript_44285/m.111580 type:complete len:102 (-) Transcript_44285:122-427(-)